MTWRQIWSNLVSVTTISYYHHIIYTNNFKDLPILFGFLVFVFLNLLIPQKNLAHQNPTTPRTTTTKNLHTFLSFFFLFLYDKLTLQSICETHQLIFFFWIWGNSTPLKTHFVSSGERVKPWLCRSQVLCHHATPLETHQLIATRWTRNFHPWII
jgi:hypothetical protein